MVNSNTVGRVGGVSKLLMGGGQGQGVRIEGGGATQQRHLGDNAMAYSDDSVQPIRKKIREHEDNSTNGGFTGMLSMSPGDKENIMQLVKKMSRKELEDLVHAKIVETMLDHSEAGKFSSAIVQLQNQKDKLQQKLSHLHKQIVQMGMAVKVSLDYASNAAKQNNVPRPIKYYRTVGLQVDTDTIREKVKDRVLRRTSDTSSVCSSKNVTSSGTGIANGPRTREKSTDPTTAADRTAMALPESTVVMDLPPFPSPSSVDVNLSVGLNDQLELPKPCILLAQHKEGIVISLSCDMPLSKLDSKIAFYEIYSFATSCHLAKTWRKVGNIDARPLPMVVTLSRFTKGCRYSLIVRAVDCHGRSGPFSNPGHIFLPKTC